MNEDAQVLAGGRGHNAFRDVDGVAPLVAGEWNWLTQASIWKQTVRRRDKRRYPKTMISGCVGRPEGSSFESQSLLASMTVTEAIAGMVLNAANECALCSQSNPLFPSSLSDKRTSPWIACYRCNSSLTTSVKPVPTFASIVSLRKNEKMTSQMKLHP